MERFFSSVALSITQVVPPSGSYPCRPDELEPFPELNSKK